MSFFFLFLFFLKKKSLEIYLFIFGDSAGITEGFSMCGGDFVEVYSDPSQVGMI